MKTLGLLLTFYKSFALASFIISLSCASITYHHGIETFAAIFWFKIITECLIVYSIHSYKNNEFYYFKNLGFSKLKLWVSTLSFDVIIFTTLIIISLKIR